MIKPHSDDPDVTHAAGEALKIIQKTLTALPKAETFDYGGHMLKLGDYGLCDRCTSPIAEAQAAEATIRTEMELTDDDTIREHLEVAADLFHAEAQAATLRAELHNGHATEPILDSVLGFLYDRQVHDDYWHHHNQGTQA
ncbi:MAG TPA: hypothetical protein VLF59_06245 [Candidatus Saccharimonadales bacterium]|nr:hypothetical protein [Candidatus Saccharimonadales bacterium]